MHDNRLDHLVGCAVLVQKPGESGEDDFSRRGVAFDRNAVEAVSQVLRDSDACWLFHVA